MSLEDDIAAIAAQEAALVFPAFDEDAAWRLGCLARDEAARRGAPAAIEIRAPLRILFAATLPGSSPDNAEWIRRKANLVLRTHRSSYGYGRAMQARGQSIADWPERNLALADHAAHGGGFPITVKGTGIVACLVVSGLPQREDHRLACWAIATALGLDPAAHDLPPG